MQKPSRCRSCNAPMIWARTPFGKDQPFDAEPNPKGNVVLYERKTETDGHVVTEMCARVVEPLFDGDAPRYMPHHATCPNADRWRRK